MTPRVTIVVVTWDGREWLAACLASIVRQDLDGVQVVVVDNGSTDGTAQWLARAHPTAELCRLPTNRGFAAGANAGLARARAPWVLMLNNDATLRPGALGTLLGVAEAAPREVYAIQPQLRLSGGAYLNSTGILLTPDGCAHDRNFGRPVAESPPAGEIWCATAGAALYRRATLERLAGPHGVFDERYHMYFEDVDLGWRARRAGGRALYVPEAVVDHVFQASSRRRGPGFIIAACKRNRLRTLLTHASPAFLLASLPRTLQDLRWLLRHAGGTALAGWVRALLDGLSARREGRHHNAVARRAVEARWIGRRQ